MSSRNYAEDLSPISNGSDTAWPREMNGYNPYNTRPDGPYASVMPAQRNEFTPPRDGPPRMNGMPPNPGFAAPTMGPPQRRRPSEAGSQQSSRAASVANSRSSDGTISDHRSRKYARMEIELQQHYTILRAFLKGSAQQPPRPNKARDKLLRLSPVQFHELSTDVFDELQRRQAAAPLPGREPRQRNVPPFLQPNQQFHEKRNQAREKLSSLQASRFRDLSTDVFCELERRFPHFANPEGRRRDSSRSVASRNGSGRPPMPQIHTGNGSVSGHNAYPSRTGSVPGGVPHFDNPPGSSSSTGSEFGRPLPKQFQSNTITPNKSTMVEDNDDEEGDDTNSPQRKHGHQPSHDPYGFGSAVTSPSSDRDLGMMPRKITSQDAALQEKVSALETALRDKSNSSDLLRNELEKKVEEAERFNKLLRDEIDRLRSEQANMERDLRSRIQSTQQDQGDTLWRAKHDQLLYEHESLQSRFQEQQKITEEVNRQGEMFLNEMRSMAENGGASFEREEKLQADVHSLEEEVKEWKARYARAKTQLRSARAMSNGVGLVGPNAVKVARDDAFHSPSGMIKDVSVSQFQIAIDQLLQTARSAEPLSVLGAMKDVVVAVRSITLDVDSAKVDNNNEETTQQRTRLRSRLSATANNVITASKNFAAADGLSPVSLLDAAASHLTAALVDLVRLVKVRPTISEDEIDEDGFVQVQNTSEPINATGYFSMTERLRKSSVAESEYSALSSPPTGTQGRGPTTDTLETSYSNNGYPGDGLGIKATVSPGEDDVELQELKIYLENQTDLLVQTIQTLVASIRNDDAVSSVHGNLSVIVDIVENVISAAEGAMEDPSSYQAELKHKVEHVVKSLTDGKDKLLQVASDPKANVEGPSSKAFTQRLPPLAFAIARETKELVSQIESVHAKGEEDFS